jgi:hypothetical protein
MLIKRLEYPDSHVRSHGKIGHELTLRRVNGIGLLGWFDVAVASVYRQGDFFPQLSFYPERHPGVPQLDPDSPADRGGLAFGTLDAGRRRVADGCWVDMARPSTCSPSRTSANASLTNL